MRKSEPDYTKFHCHIIDIIECDDICGRLFDFLSVVFFILASMGRKRKRKICEQKIKQSENIILTEVSKT